MADPIPGSLEWHAQVVEDILDPDRKIVDPHHHLWRRGIGNDYLLADLRGDTDSGHRIEKTVFVECHSEYRTDGPEHLRPVGETEFVAEVAAESARGTERQARIAGIVAHADLTLGDAVEEVLNAHEATGLQLFKGIRHAGARAEDPTELMISGRAIENLYEDNKFRQGMKVLGRMGLTYDTWHYHYQNRAFAELARAVPDTTMILDHFGTPLGVGRYESKREEIFEQWKKDIAEIARCENVVAKLGGLAMPDNGFGWHLQAMPPTSDEFVAAQKRYYLHTIECFGPDRCMFESNFPVDKYSISYHVLWNGLKKIAQDFSEDEKNAMFSGTASGVYRL
jgi:predicted TIM-barrel fold metal-dependent hydrolase